MKKYVSIAIALLFTIALLSIASGAFATAAPKKGKSAGGAAPIYQQYCVKCHGADGKGIASLEPPDFTNASWQAKESDAKLTQSITDGVGVMPGYKSSLSAAQIKALVRHVRAFAKK
jgi:mono/diheme cytochrome c family protein